MRRTHVILLAIWILLCISGFIYLTGYQRTILITDKIEYVSTTDSVLYIAWGVNYLQMPSAEYIPDDSHIQNNLVYTRMNRNRDTFYRNFTLPHGTNFNYWIFRKKTDHQNEKYEFLTSDYEQAYINKHFNSTSLFRPGYLIFLAGLLPLLVVQLKRNKIADPNEGNTVTINQYIPQFDSLRTFAVAMVIFHHWGAVFKLPHIFPFGDFGVNIFFVLSGFLITRILLKEKKSLENGGISKISVFKNFYIRRTLRIFPIYYILLLILYFFRHPSVLKDAEYYFSYTSNILFYTKQFFPPHVSHLWSLSVEEQFYIIWPWLIIFINNRYLLLTMLTFLLIGYSSNFIFTEHEWWVMIFTPACFDAFAIGGILSFFAVYRNDIAIRIKPYLRYLFIGSLLLLVADHFSVPYIPRRTIHSLFAGTVLFHFIFCKENKAINKVFLNKWLISIGKISYGIYLYHLLIPDAWNYVIASFKSNGVDLLFNQSMPSALKSPWLFVQYIIILLFISIISWKLIEKPINSLKRNFGSTNQEKKQDK